MKITKVLTYICLVFGVLTFFSIFFNVLVLKSAPISEAQLETLVLIKTLLIAIFWVLLGLSISIIAKEK